MKVNLLGVNFDSVDLDEAVEKIEKMIKNGGCHQVGTLNPEYLVKAQTSKQLMRVIARMDLVVPDGVGIIWAAKIKKLGKLKRIRGGDLVEKLSELCARKGYKIALVGGEEGVAQKALLVLQKKNPALRGFADRGPDFVPAGQRDTSDGGPTCPPKPRRRREGLLRGGGIGEQEITKKIEKEKSKILFTALSFKGPIWIDKLLSRLKKKGISLVALEIGGVFNYLAGKAKKPPKIIQKIGLEWLWRLFWEPWRIKRQLSLLRFLSLLFRLEPKEP